MDENSKYALLSKGVLEECEFIVLAIGNKPKLQLIEKEYCPEWYRSPIIATDKAGFEFLSITIDEMLRDFSLCINNNMGTYHGE